MATVRFDATVDFDAPGALETELQAAMAVLGAQDIYGAHVPAHEEAGELVSAYDTTSRPVQEDDWYVIGHTAAELASELRRLLHSAVGQLDTWPAFRPQR